MILFDFDGTLVRDWEMVYSIWKEFGAEIGMKLTKKEFRDKQNPEWQTFLKEVYNTSLEEHKDLFNRIVIGEYNRKILTQTVDKDLASYLKTINFGVVTAGFSMAAKKILSKQKLKPEIIVSSQETGTSNKAELLEFALKKAEAKIYVCDTEQDVIATKKVGIKSAAVTWGFHPLWRIKRAEPDFIIRNILQLKNMISTERFE